MLLDVSRQDGDLNFHVENIEIFFGYLRDFQNKQLFFLYMP